MSVKKSNELTNFFSRRDIFWYIYVITAFVSVIFFSNRLLYSLNRELYTASMPYFILNTFDLNTNIWLASYTHTDYTHFFSNIIIYITLAFTIIEHVKDTEKINKMMQFCLLILPFILSAYSIYYSPTDGGGGLSGITSCMYGYLFFTGYYYLKNELQAPLRIHSIIAVIFFNVFITLHYYFGTISFVILPPMAILFLLENRNISSTFHLIWKRLMADRHPNTFKLLILTVLFVVFSIGAFSLFVPTVPTNLNINYEIHAIGFFFGLIVSFKTLNLS
jgi:hypothetical protein